MVTRMRAAGLGAVMLSSALSTLAVAQQAGDSAATDSDPAVLLDTVVVTGTRAPESAQDVPTSLSIVTDEEIVARGYTFVGDELVGVPGVNTQRLNDGTYTGVSMRGVPNVHHNDTVLMLVDGVPFITGNDEADLELLPYSIVERVEVVRGPVSALYGRGGISGALNYLTKRPGDTVPEGSLAGGSFGFGRATGLYSGQLAVDTSVLALVSAETKDGFRDRTARDAQNLFLKLEHGFSKNVVLRLALSGLDSEQQTAGALATDAQGQRLDLPGGRKANYNLDDAHYDKQVVNAAAILDWVWTEQLSSRSTLNYRDADTSFLGGFYSGFAADTRTLNWLGFWGANDTKTAYLEQHISWIGPRYSLVGGLAYEDVQTKATEDWTGEFDYDALFYTQRRNVDTGVFLNQDQWITDRLLDADADANIFSTYLQGDLNLTPQLGLSLGARYDRFEREVHFGPSRTGYGENEVRTASQTNDHLSPKAALRYRLSPLTTAYLAYGQGFSPAFGAIWAFGGDTRRNQPDPELADNIELGFKGRAFGQRLRYTAAIYQLERRDLLQLVNTQTTPVSINAGQQRSRGFELETDWVLGTLHKGLSARLAYTYTDSVWIHNEYAQEFGPDVNFTDKDVAGVPEHSLWAGFQQELPSQWNVQAWVEYSGDYWFDNANTVRGGSVALLNAALGWRPPALPTLALNLSARNLLDKNYDAVYGYGTGSFAAYPGQPLQLLLNAAWRF